jgi:hypothetical protein
MALLKDEGLIDVTRGRRATVAANPLPATIAGYAHL